MGYRLPVAATLDWPKEAGNPWRFAKPLLRKPCPTLQAAGPVGWVLAPFESQHGFDEVDGEHAGHARCQD